MIDSSLVSNLTEEKSLKIEFKLLHKITKNNNFFCSRIKFALNQRLIWPILNYFSELLFEKNKLFAIFIANICSIQVTIVKSLYIWNRKFWYMKFYKCKHLWFYWNIILSVFFEIFFKRDNFVFCNLKQLNLKNTLY